MALQLLDPVRSSSGGACRNRTNRGAARPEVSSVLAPTCKSWCGTSIRAFGQLRRLTTAPQVKTTDIVALIIELGAALKL
jgi:hypothetical protein